MSDSVTFVNELGREIVVPATETDLISRLQKLGLRVLTGGKRVSQNGTALKQQKTIEPYEPPAFEFYPPFDNLLTRAFHECFDIKDAREFYMVVQDLEDYKDMPESECVRCWRYYITREEWRQEHGRTDN